jgi:hydrogenase expression/formation protein HypD
VKYLDEYRDPNIARRLLGRIREVVTRRWIIMEVCGGQTHAIVRNGIDRMLPDLIELVHGPGCPVCVTALETIDRAHAIAARTGVIFTSFGDMLRVPGSRYDLLGLRARGADVRVVYSPLDAVQLARDNPQRSVVFFGIGFETTAPANAMALREAKRLGVTNFSMLASHVLVPPALASILESSDNRVDGFLGPGHVCAVTGYDAYDALVAQYRTPIVVTGFELVDILEGILMVVRQLEDGRAAVENQYVRGATRDGNQVARELVEEVFEVTDQTWRGIGITPRSGLRLRREYLAHDAQQIHDVTDVVTREEPRCISGLVLRGQKKPCDCPAFGTACTPATPLGATMVSAEGACAAYYANGRRRIPSADEETDT